MEEASTRQLNSEPEHADSKALDRIPRSPPSDCTAGSSSGLPDSILELILGRAREEKGGPKSGKGSRRSLLT